MKVLFLILILPVIIYAQQAKWYDDIKLNGFVSTTYTYNFNDPASNKNQYRIFDFADNTISVDVAELVFQKPVTNMGDAGFRLDLTAGSSIPRVATSTKDTGEFALQQIFISYIAKIGNGLKIDAGKFVSPVGYEVIEGYDGYNDNASRSYLCGYAMPYTNTGVRISYPFSKQFNAMLYVTNGWDNSTDNNKSKSIGVQATYLPSDQVTLTGNFLGGPEQNNDNSRNRSIYDFSLLIKLNDRLSIGVNGDYGTEQKSDINGNAAQWYGAACYVRYYLTDDFSFAFRGEAFNDWSGTRTGIAQRLDEFTLTPEYKINKNIIVRGDLRYDESNLDVFEKGDQFLSHQLTVSLNMLFIL
jgi:hypothetical protein